MTGIEVAKKCMTGRKFVRISLSQNITFNFFFFGIVTTNWTNMEIKLPVKHEFHKYTPI